MGRMGNGENSRGGTGGKGRYQGPQNGCLYGIVEQAALGRIIVKEQLPLAVPAEGYNSRGYSRPGLLVRKDRCSTACHIQQ